MLTLEKITAGGRAGMVNTRHGNIQTPFFMPVATTGAMKGITLQDLEEMDAQILLCNTYHIHLHPHESVVKRNGGLHNFIGWQKPILTDSGGFQIFSLSKIRRISDEDVVFYNHRNGKEMRISPEDAIHIQHDLGADIMMCLDECIPSTATRKEQMQAVDRTIKWAKRCKDMHVQLIRGQEKNVHLFGIVQGGLERDLREKCTEELIAIGFDGYAIGGLAVGETEYEMLSVLDVVCPLLPKEKLRYLMGVGRRNQLKEAVKKGIDMFDCVAPMREARHGNIWMTNGEKLRIRRSEFLSDDRVLDEQSPVKAGRTSRRSYVHHLLKVRERYGETIACLQNMAVILETMKNLRKEIREE